MVGDSGLSLTRGQGVPFVSRCQSKREIKRESARANSVCCRCRRIKATIPLDRDASPDLRIGGNFLRFKRPDAPAWLVLGVSVPGLRGLERRRVSAVLETGASP